MTVKTEKIITVLFITASLLRAPFFLDSFVSVKSVPDFLELSMTYETCPRLSSHVTKYMKEFDPSYGIRRTAKYRYDSIRKVLRELHRVFDQLGIRLVLHAGTLLGYMRHQDILVYDDDADVFMDYDECVRLFPTNGNLQEKVQSLTDLDKYAPVGFSCEGSRDSVSGIGLVFSGKFVSKETGFYVDVFTFKKKWVQLNAVSHHRDKFNPYRSTSKYTGTFRTVSQSSIDALGNPIDVIKSTDDPTKCCPESDASLNANNMFNWSSLRGSRINSNPNLEYLVTSPLHFVEFKVPYNILYPLQKVPFIGIEAYIPADPKNFLTALYGMDLEPPKEWRNSIFIQASDRSLFLSTLACFALGGLSTVPLSCYIWMFTASISRMIIQSCFIITLLIYDSYASQGVFARVVDRFSHSGTHKCSTKSPMGRRVIARALSVVACVSLFADFWWNRSYESFST